MMDTYLSDVRNSVASYYDHVIDLRHYYPCSQETFSPSLLATVGFHQNQCNFKKLNNFFKQILRACQDAAIASFTVFQSTFKICTSFCILSKYYLTLELSYAKIFPIYGGSVLTALASFSFKRTTEQSIDGPEMCHPGSGLHKKTDLEAARLQLALCFYDIENSGKHQATIVYSFTSPVL